MLCPNSHSKARVIQNEHNKSVQVCVGVCMCLCRHVCDWYLAWFQIREKGPNGELQVDVCYLCQSSSLFHSRALSEHLHTIPFQSTNPSCMLLTHIIKNTHYLGKWNSLTKASFYWEFSIYSSVTDNVLTFPSELFSLLPSLLKLSINKAVRCGGCIYNFQLLKEVMLRRKNGFVSCELGSESPEAVGGCSEGGVLTLDNIVLIPHSSKRTYVM